MAIVALETPIHQHWLAKVVFFGHGQFHHSKWVASPGECPKHRAHVIFAGKGRHERKSNVPAVVVFLVVSHFEFGSHETRKGFSGAPLADLVSRRIPAFLVSKLIHYRFSCQLAVNFANIRHAHCAPVLRIPADNLCNRFR